MVKRVPLPILQEAIDSGFEHFLDNALVYAFCCLGAAVLLPLLKANTKRRMGNDTDPLVNAFYCSVAAVLLLLVLVVWVLWRSLAFFSEGYFFRIGGVVVSFLVLLFVVAGFAVWGKQTKADEQRHRQDSNRLDVSATIAAAERASRTTPGSDWPEPL
jgi:hypothetical protein